MKYIIKGQLTAAICKERSYPLGQTVIRLYRVMHTDAAAALVSAQAKETFQLIEEKHIEEKANALIAETTTDSHGNYVFNIDSEKSDYQGEAVEVYLYYPTIPDYGQNEQKGTRPFKPFLILLNVLFPKWKESDDKLVAGWKYRIPRRNWCYILKRLDLWFICGRLTVCGSNIAIPGIEVIAMDDDIISDDKLGSAITDSNGWFCIVYTSKTFKKTFLSPWINVETPFFPVGNGPDVYFKYAIAGSIFESESPSRGRQADRENIGNCFCVNLCLKEGVIEPDPDIPIAAFFRIGQNRRYHILSNIDNTTGRTTYKPIASWNDLAFYSTIALIGSLSKKMNAQPMEYLFEIREYDSPGGTPLSGWTEVPKSQIANSVIGYKQELTSDPMNPVKTTEYAIHPEVGEEEVFFDGNWIKVPQVAGFIPNADGVLIKLRTQSFTGSDVDMTALVPGSSTTTVSSLRKNKYYKLRMKKREAGNLPSSVVAGTSKAIAIFNDIYKNVPQKGSWLPHTSDERGVASIDLMELAGGGCAKVTTTLNAKYTAAIPNLGTVRLSMIGPGGPHSFAPVVYPSPGEEAFGTSAYVGVVATLPNCSYIVRVHADMMLTNGEHQHHDIWDEVAFCK
jgi:hypothetical protein